MNAAFETAQLAVAAKSKCEDHVAVFEFEGGVVLAVADGAGGIGNGAQASRAVIAELRGSASLDLDESAWCSLLRQIDHRIGDGESTCVVLAATAQGIIGASVGDSQAWFVHDGGIVNLTQRQIRKPLLGSGQAEPVGFSHPTSQGLIVVSTDGFCNYIRKERFLREYLWHDFVVLPRKLVEMVRLPSGDLWDDIGIVVCRPRRIIQSLKRYSLDDVD
ncbi:MAG: protein phosphatase 2C domain-containing protein [Planctomycetota bacterium]